MTTLETRFGKFNVWNALQSMWSNLVISWNRTHLLVLLYCSKFWKNWVGCTRQGDQSCTWSSCDSQFHCQRYNQHILIKFYFIYNPVLKSYYEFNNSPISTLVLCACLLKKEPSPRVPLLSSQMPNNIKSFWITPIATICHVF